MPTPGETDNPAPSPSDLSAMWAQLDEAWERRQEALNALQSAVKTYTWHPTPANRDAMDAAKAKFRTADNEFLELCAKCEAADPRFNRGAARVGATDSAPPATIPRSAPFPGRNGAGW